MTNDVQGVPTPTAPLKRPLLGLGVGVGVLALVVVPVGVAALGALASFSGCFIGCSEPQSDPMSVVFFAGAALFMLAIPVFAGLATARVLTARGWRTSVTTALVVAGLVLAVLFLAATSR